MSDIFLAACGEWCGLQPVCLDVLVRLACQRSLLNWRGVTSLPHVSARQLLILKIPNERFGPTALR